MSNRDLIIKLEHLAFRAMPALNTEDYDGWLLRFAEGYTGRANSVNPMHAGELDLEEKIIYCEQRYDQEGLATLFRLTDVYQPPQLEDMLIARGYQRRMDSPVSIYTASISEAAITPAPYRIYSFSKPDVDWIQPYTALVGTPSRAVPTMHRMMQRIESDACFMVIKNDEDEAVAAGMAVCEDGWVGLFNIVVASRHRRRGLGHMLVQSLLNWGVQHDAQQAYLQVVDSNAPALGLYAKLGFARLYNYWYRLKVHSDQV